MNRELRSGLIIGLGQSITFLALLTILGVLWLGPQQEAVDQIGETQTIIADGNERTVAAILCATAAQTRALNEDPESTDIPEIPEALVNGCMAALGFEGIDLNGDGNIATKGSDTA